MAKMTTHWRSSDGKQVRLPAEVFVRRNASRGGAFFACVKIGSQGRTHRKLTEDWMNMPRGSTHTAKHMREEREHSGASSAIGMCAAGKNPRDALAKALTAAGRAMKGRRGAFAGMKGRR